VPLSSSDGYRRRLELFGLTPQLATLSLARQTVAGTDGYHRHLGVFGLTPQLATLSLACQTVVGISDRKECPGTVVEGLDASSNSKH
jgi:hypothetical protein